MSTKLKKRSLLPPAEPLAQDNDFDFEHWAKAVRRQLLDALQKSSDRS